MSPTATETCDPENPLQLITDVRVAPNTTEDETLLTAALPELKQRTDLDTLYTDGAYGGPQSDTVLREQQVTLIQTAIKGLQLDPRLPAGRRFRHHAGCCGCSHLIMTCPEGQTVPVTPGGKPQRFAAQFAPPTCEACPLYAAGRCPPQPDNRRRSLRLTFDQAEVEKAQRHRRVVQRTSWPATYGPPSRPPSARSSIPSEAASYPCVACSASPA